MYPEGIKSRFAIQPILLLGYSSYDFSPDFTTSNAIFSHKILAYPYTKIGKIIG